MATIVTIAVIAEVSVTAYAAKQEAVIAASSARRGCAMKGGNVRVHISVCRAVIFDSRFSVSPPKGKQHIG